MLTMRYLLAFFSETTSQWRCIDTALLPVQATKPENIPAVLANAPAMTLSWMLERRTFGCYQATGHHDGDAAIMVYELHPTGPSPLGNGMDYVGPWLEMFMQTRAPVGMITLTTKKPIPQGPGIGALRQLATSPLQASDEACQQTMNRIRDHAPSATKQAESTPEAKRHVTA